MNILLDGIWYFGPRISIWNFDLLHKQYFSIQRFRSTSELTSVERLFHIFVQLLSKEEDAIKRILARIRTLAAAAKSSNSYCTVHPRQPLTGDLKMHFRFGARIFTAASNLRSKWTPVFTLLARIWDIGQSLLIKFFVARLEGESGKCTGTYRQTVSELCFSAFNTRASTAPLPAGLG